MHTDASHYSATFWGARVIPIALDTTCEPKVENVCSKDTFALVHSFGGEFPSKFCLQALRWCHYYMTLIEKTKQNTDVRRKRPCPCMFLKAGFTRPWKSLPELLQLQVHSE